MSELPQDPSAKGSDPTPGDGKDTPRLPTILVVEHEILVRLPVCDYLRNCGFRVLEASNAADAQTLLGAAEDIAIVFSAVDLPGTTNGFGLATWVRRHHPAVKIILTAGVRDKARLAAEFCEEHQFLERPYGYEVLLAHIHAMLGRGSAEGLS